MLTFFQKSNKVKYLSQYGDWVYRSFLVSFFQKVSKDLGKHLDFRCKKGRYFLKSELHFQCYVFNFYYSKIYTSLHDNLVKNNYYIHLNNIILHSVKYRLFLELFQVFYRKKYHIQLFFYDTYLIKLLKKFSFF